MKYSKYPSRACTCFTALCEDLRPLEYDLVIQFSRSQLNAREPGCASVEDTYSWKNYSSIYVKMVHSYAVHKSKPASTYPHWHHLKKPKPTKLFAESKSEGSKESCPRCLHTHHRVSSWQKKMLKVRGSAPTTEMCHSHSNLGNYGIGRMGWRMVVDLALFSSSSLRLLSAASSSIKGRGGRRKRDWPRGRSRKQTAVLSSPSVSPLIPGEHSYAECLSRLTFC